MLTPWQDKAMALLGLLFSVSLWPSVWRCYRRRVPSNLSWWTCGLTAGGLYALAVVVATLGFWWAVACDALTGLAWMALLASKALYPAASYDTEL